MSKRRRRNERRGRMSGERGIRPKRVRRPAFHGARINYTGASVMLRECERELSTPFSFSIRLATSVFVVRSSRFLLDGRASPRTGLWWIEKERALVDLRT